MTLNPVLVLVVLALLAKVIAILISVKLDYSKGISKIFSSLLIVSVLHTVTELTGFYFWYYDRYSDWVVSLLKLYYCFLIAIFILVNLALWEIAYKKIRVLYLFHAVTLLLCLYWILFTNAFIAGYHETAYFYGNTRGEYHGWLEIYLCLLLISNLIVLIRGNLYGETEFNRARSFNLLLAYLPLLISSLGVLILMKLRFNINAAGIFPFVLSVLLIMIAENLKSYNVLDFRIFVPWSRKRQLLREITAPFKLISPEQGLYKEYKNNIEGIWLHLADDMFVERKDAAAWLGISPSTLSKKLGPKKKKL